MSTPPRTAIELRVRYAETDQMGVVYHSNYLIWCEIARTELIRQRGPSYAELERDGVILAVTDASMRFHSPARYDDTIRAESWIEEIRSRTVTFAYEILRVEDQGSAAPERLVTAKTRLIALGHDTRPRKLPPELIHALENG